MQLRAVGKAFSLSLSELIEAMIGLTVDALPQSVSDYVGRCLAAGGLIETDLREPVWPSEEMARRLLEKRGSWVVTHRDELDTLRREVDRQRALARKMEAGCKDRDRRLVEATADRMIYSSLVSAAEEVLSRAIHLDSSCASDHCVCPMAQLAKAVADAKARLAMREAEDWAAGKEA
jgi:hypothetical protein